LRLDGSSYKILTKCHSGIPPLLVDFDGVLSLFGFATSTPPRGRMALLDRLPQLSVLQATASLNRLAARYDCVWCTGWEEG